MFDVIAAERRIRLVQHVNQTGLVVLADRQRVLQLLSNLIGNALKFAPQESDVTIEVDRHQQMVRLAVRDAGRGIATENLRYVFDRFWKSDDEEAKGTGLGLFIAKGIAEAHGGRIWVESRLGCGAAFYFTLPLDATTTTETSSAALVAAGVSHECESDAAPLPAQTDPTVLSGGGHPGVSIRKAAWMRQPRWI